MLTGQVGGQPRYGELKAESRCELRRAEEQQVTAEGQLFPGQRLGHCRRQRRSHSDCLQLRGVRGMVNGGVVAVPSGKNGDPNQADRAKQNKGAAPAHPCHREHRQRRRDRAGETAPPSLAPVHISPLAKPRSCEGNQGRGRATVLEKPRIRRRRKRNG